MCSVLTKILLWVAYLPDKLPYIDYNMIYRLCATPNEEHNTFGPCQLAELS